jgi:hypothetical protein
MHGGPGPRWVLVLASDSAVVALAASQQHSIQCMLPAGETAAFAAVGELYAHACIACIAY